MAPVVDEEERGNGADMKRGHRDGGDPVHALLVLAPVHQSHGVAMDEDFLLLDVVREGRHWTIAGTAANRL